jgi:hypothetical protein
MGPTAAVASREGGEVEESDGLWPLVTEVAVEEK